MFNGSNKNKLTYPIRTDKLDRNEFDMDKLNVNGVISYIANKVTVEVI